MWPFLTHGKFNVVIVIRGLGFLYRFQERPGTSMTLQPENCIRNDEYHKVVMEKARVIGVVCYNRNVSIYIDKHVIMINNNIYVYTVVNIL